MAKAAEKGVEIYLPFTSEQLNGWTALKFEAVAT